MAEAGLQVFNDNQILQIDSTYANARLIGKYTATPNVSYSRSVCFQYSTDVQIGGTAPYVAYKANSDTFVVVYMSNGARYVRVENKDATPVTLYVFDQSPPPTQGFGFEVFNAQGQIVFSGAERYCKVLGLKTLKFDPDAFKSYTFQAAGRNVAVIANSNAKEISSGPSIEIDRYDILYYNSFARTTQDSAVITYTNTQTIQGARQPPAWGGEVTGYYLFVDVSNM